MNKHTDDLVASIVDLDDYELASTSLLELSKVEPSLARNLAKEILSEKRGDAFLEAAAFGVLYYIDRCAALDITIRTAESVDPFLLEAMAECVLEDSAKLDGDVQLAEAILSIKRGVEMLSPADLDKVNDVVIWFFSSFSFIDGRVSLTT